MKIVEKLQLGRLATPLPDRRRPVYNWFPMKEAFSRDLVGLLVETWGLREGNLVLDPFVGVGTTALACKELGIDCVGYDVHPALLLASRVKVGDYDIDKLRAAVRELMGSKFEKSEVKAPGFVARVFPKPVLEDLAHFRRRISEVRDEVIREFMSLGLAVAAMKCSWARKEGAAIRVVKRPVPPLRKELKRQLLRMCVDLELFRAKGAKVTIEHCDARKIRLGDESVDAVITSPPYLNKPEYIHAYRLEQWIMGLESPDVKELVGVREGAGEDLSEVSEFSGPPEAKIYFKDLLAVLRELHRVCRRGAKLCFVTSDGCFPDGVVEVCGALSELAERAGLKAKRIIVVNKRYCTTPARRKIGITREGLLLWEK